MLGQYLDRLMEKEDENNVEYWKKMQVDLAKVENRLINSNYMQIKFWRANMKDWIGVFKNIIS